MSEEELNKKYIKNKIEGICQDCMWLDKIVPIIKEMLSQQYIEGLEQGKFDKEMDLAPERINLRNENLKLKSVLKEIREYVDNKLTDYNLRYGITNEFRCEWDDLLEIIDKGLKNDE